MRGIEQLRPRVQALTDALTPDGTLVMPTFTGDNSDPAAWSRPPVPEEWFDIIRETMPAYDPAVMLKIVLLAYSRGVISSRAGSSSMEVVPGSMTVRV